ncbi:hypothetical protein [Niabella drilacis]|uniref:Uncharacterized protein n=1 Tax=Niabella drilacis (strain DSM 25811 / CCM 8410 / CCUG 62505 / LMG 26954 / E90) TaxID=1285928 RepID=A0A1G6HWY3_NIADE|nr:hypothetical protein [Niabella drilacis]SDB98700.1 hypothetical protein SAMN04487894_1013 [Niabella drilacis]
MLGVALLWLTVSLPFVYEAKIRLAERTETRSKDRSNPLAGATEEKVPSNPTITITEEYLHHGMYDFSLTRLQKDNAYLHAHEGTYIAFHAELHAPPPNTML